MWIGLGITLLVVGGICAFGVRDQWSVIDLTAIGYILMAVGVLAIILSLVVTQTRRRTTHHTTVVDHRGDPPPPTPPA